MHGSRRVLYAAVVVAVLVYGWVDARQRACLDRGLKRHRTDFTVYQSAARALAAGEDPYAAESPRGYRYVYPPFLAVLLMPVADWAPEDAAYAFFVVSAAALATAAAALARFPHPSGRAVGARAVLVGLLVCAPFLHPSFQRSQATVLLVALGTGALCALVRGRALLAGFLL